MKIKKLIIYTFFLLSVTSYSQNKIFNGEVQYEASMKVNEAKLDSISKKIKGSEGLKKRMITSMKNQGKVKFKLLFNDIESLFKEEEGLKIVENQINFTKIMMGSGMYHTNKYSKKISIQKEAYGQLFIVDVPMLQWELTQESKKIDNYTCYKAITNKQVENKRGKFIKKITAWYAPKLPINFGPKDYFGLPGLILELQEGSLLIKATKINLATNNKNDIKKHPKGKKISLKDFNELSKKMYENKRN